MTEEPPAYEDAIKTYVDKPNAITIFSGGIFLAAVSYLISNFFFELFGIENNIFNFILPVFIILSSFSIASGVDAEIQINTKNGYIKASGGGFKYEGYATEPERFMVLQRQTQGRGDRNFTDYKLNLKVDDETSFNIPLQASEVRNAIKFVEKAKKAVPIKRN